MSPNRRSKIWLITALVSVVIFFAFNFLIWSTGINKLFVAYPNCGDLARLAVAPEFSDCREESSSLDIQAKTSASLKKFEVITIGDSISRGRGGGQNNYWQDWLATNSGLRVAWYPEQSDNYAQDIVLLLNSGYLSSRDVKYVIVQSTERQAIERFARDINWNATLDILDIEKYEQDRRGGFKTDLRWVEAYEARKYANDAGGFVSVRAGLTQFIFMMAGDVIVSTDRKFNTVARLFGIPKIISGSRPTFSLTNSLISRDERFRAIGIEGVYSFAAQGLQTPMSAAIYHNYNWFRHILGRHRILDQDKYFEKVQFMKIDRELFSGANGTKLMFDLSDWKANRQNRDDVGIQTMHENLNRLADLLKSEEIDLYFMPSPTKLTAYQRFLTEKIETESTFFPRLRSLEGKRYKFIDTAQIIDSMISEGVKDVYYMDDTHWTFKALDQISRLFEFPK